MKIALINNLYNKQKRGGAEIIVENLKIGLEKKGHSCFVISSAPKNIVKTHNKEKENKNNHYLIASCYYNLNKKNKILRLLWHLYKQVEPFSKNKIKKILRKEKPDLIISHNLLGFSSLIYKTIYKLNIYHIHYLHDIQMLHPSGRMIYGQEKIINTFYAKLYQKWQKKISSKIDLIVSPSKWLLKLHQNKKFFLSQNTWQHFNPISEERIKEENDLNNNLIKKDNFNFIYVGQVDKSKGIDLLLQAFLKLKDNKIKLNIVGDGQDLKYYKNKYYNFKNINFLGKLPYSKSLIAIKDSDTLILPSLIYENSPTAIFDALRVNTNIIASNIGGNKEIINKYYGQLFQANNIEDLKIKMKENINLKNKKNINTKKAVDLNDLQLENYLQKLLEKLHFS